MLRCRGATPLGARIVAGAIGPAPATEGNRQETTAITGGNEEERPDDGQGAEHYVSVRTLGNMLAGAAAMQSREHTESRKVESMEIVEMIGTGDTPHPSSGAVWEADGKQYGATVHAGEGLVTIWTQNHLPGPSYIAGARRRAPNFWESKHFPFDPEIFRSRPGIAAFSCSCSQQ